ncbi:MarR family winged helix-turn-helix transcriptional regulator [Aerococcus urinaeequi]|uniref:MarR family winged helix-turn-helix transcriptional regulator n=1 Tax=Aerococcus urinaeequi TaxID=51665 RepID=UPI003AAE62B0
MTHVFPNLPEGIKLSYLYVLYAISKLGENVRITDISKEMLISSPNITALVNEIEEKGFVMRERSQTDKRVSYITSTKEGKELLDKYYLQYKKEVANSIDIPEKQLMSTIETLNQLEKYFVDASDKMNKEQ